MEDILSDLFAQNMVENYDKEDFLPLNKQAELLTSANIKACMPGSSPELDEFVADNAKTVFAILVYCGISKSNLAEALQLCSDHGFTDQTLPIPNPADEKQCLLRASHNCSANASCQRHPHLSVFHTWGFRAWKDFYLHQERFRAPALEFRGLNHRFDPGRILPFSKGDGSGQGHFGFVQQAFLDPYHLLGVPENRKAPISVAIKEFTNRGRDSREPSARAAWKAELEALKNIKPHDHLIEFIAAIDMGDQYFLISEWADGGDLQTFWQTEKNPKPDSALILEVLTQLHGMADALQSLHRPLNFVSRTTADEAEFDIVHHDPGTPLVGSTVARPNPRIVVSPTTDDSNDLNGSNSEDSSNWRHGDLKPANILRFKKHSRLGCLKIGDLGLAKNHPRETCLRTTGSSRWYGTQAYEPPEVFTRRAKPRSRRYDIWSFGCITLEMIIWLLYGNDGLQKFLSSPIEHSKQTIYYTVLAETTAEVNRSLVKVMNAILQHDPECSAPQGSALRDLLLLVKDKLLVVALDEDLPGHRIDGKQLLDELANILDKAKLPGQDLYLWTRMQRETVTYQSITDGIAFTGPNAQQTYRHERVDSREWTYVLDNVFANQAIKGIAIMSNFSYNTEASTICQRCFTMIQHMLPLQSRPVTELQGLSKHCNLCALLSSVPFKNSSNTSELTTQRLPAVRRSGSKLFIELENDSNSVWLIRQMPGALSTLYFADFPALQTNISYNFSIHESFESHHDVQVSLPWLFEMGSAAHAELLRQWLLDCDENHLDCRHTTEHTVTTLPTRLVQIGSNGDSRVRLVETSELQQHQPRFAALSYPWGYREIDHHLSTTIHNYEDHKHGIMINTLPKLLQHAVQIARDIGMAYLWIDALCIKQGHGGDFHKEARRMEDVFSTAYCVIAASRTKGVADDVLGKRKPRVSVRIPNSSLFLCEDIDEFQHDVMDGYLNTRGWVLQERALARRTIYFAEGQSYFECGEGVRCETFTKMKNKQAAILGDPSFPRMAEKDTKGGRIRQYESLYEQYSRLQFKNRYDRPIAIAGLERRLCRAFKTDGGFGVFHRYFRRGILWQRAADTASLAKITFPSTQEYIPSWSWMAYEGAIQFPPDDALPLGGVDWLEDEYRSPWSFPSSSNFEFHVTPRDFYYEFYVQKKSQSGIVWDGGAAAEGTLKCAVIGKLRAQTGLETQKHFVLILRLTGTPNTYERVGTGWLAKNQIDFRETHEQGIVR